MDFSQENEPRDSESLRNVYEDTFDTPDYESWNAMFSVSHPDASGNQASPEGTKTVSGFTFRPSYSRDDILALHSFSSCHSAEAPFSHPAIQAPAEFPAVSDIGLTLQSGGTNGMSSCSRLGKTISSNLVEVVSTESAGHESEPDILVPPDRSYDIRCGLEQQPLAPLQAYRTSGYDTHHEDLLLGFSGSLHSQMNQYTDCMLADSRAGCITSDDLATPYFHSLEEDQHDQQQDATYMGDYEKALMEHTSDKSPVRRHGHQLGVCSASDPKSPSNLSPRDLSTSSPYTNSSTSATKNYSLENSWKCDNCGIVLTTKGTKNRNRNKRRHHCPGTAPKYPCSMCPKSFNRGDTRLLHLRKSHREIHIEPPRPRKRKNL